MARSAEARDVAATRQAWQDAELRRHRFPLGSVEWRVAVIAAQTAEEIYRQLRRRSRWVGAPK